MSSCDFSSGRQTGSRRATPAPRRSSLPEARLEGKTINFAGAREEKKPLQQLGNKNSSQAKAGWAAGWRLRRAGLLSRRLVPAHGCVALAPPQAPEGPLFTQVTGLETVPNFPVSGT